MFVLPKGTVVKHGTTLSRARAILQYGLTPKADRQDKRIENEFAPEIDGIYVGNLLAYFGAYAAYSAELNDFRSRTDFLQAMMCLEEPQQLKRLDLSAAPIDLPVVLRVRLAEDCTLYADEDFVADGRYPVDQRVPTAILEREAEHVWYVWQTGCIVRAGGIPPAWIETIEYPRVVSLEATQRLHKDTWADCELFIAGIMQASLKKQPKSLLDPFLKRYKREYLSQSVPATEAGIDRIESLRGLTETGSAYFNHVSISQAVEHMAEEYGIPLHRD